MATKRLAKFEVSPESVRMTVIVEMKSAVCFRVFVRGGCLPDGRDTVEFRNASVAIDFAAKVARDAILEAVNELRYA